MSNAIISPESIIVRRLRPDELLSFKQFLLDLDDNTRRDRFCGTVSDTFIAQYAEETWQAGTLLIGTFAEGRLCGVAELHPAGADRTGEAAFAVRPEFRKRGMGSSLLTAILLAAEAKGYQRIRTACLPANAAMRQLARKAGAALHIQIDEVMGEIPVPLPVDPSEGVRSYKVP
jgi:RimJ/RimL family protein N-acetyltransferase